MTPYLLEDFSEKLGNPKWFWPVVFASVFPGAFFAIEIIERLL